MIIDLMRHGEVEGKTCFRGHTDDPLSSHGWQQMETSLTKYSVDTIVSSPLKRCSDFAKKLSSSRNLTFEINSNFMEINFGDWDGLTAEDIKVDHENELLKFWSDPVTNTPPNGETLLNFQNRIVTEWHKTILTHKEKNVLLITHAGVIKIIIAHVLSMPLEKLHSIECALASLSRIRISFDEDDTQYTSLVFHSVTASGIER